MFRTKKNTKRKWLLYLGIFLVSVSLSIKFIYRENKINENTFLDFLVSDLFVSNDQNVFDVDFLFKYAFDLEIEEIVNEESELVFKEENNNENVNDEPLVYIYNTHQTEKYKSDYLETYNISSTVLVAAKILKEYLKDLGINAIVEEDSVEDKLHSLNWKYGYSYKVSRMFMESAKEKNPSLKYFIDLHRDSSAYEKTTTEIDGEKYVKLLFVVGLDNENYEPNLKLAEDLSNIIKRYNKNLYRGIMKKSGKGVNGVYNQDFSPNVFLVEVGGQYNNISEVNNTLKIFANVLNDYIKENSDA